MRPGALLYIAVPFGGGLHNLPFHFTAGFTHRFFEYHGGRLGLEVLNMTYGFTPWTTDTPRLVRLAQRWTACLDGINPQLKINLGLTAPAFIDLLAKCPPELQNSRLDVQLADPGSLEMVFPDALETLLRKLPVPGLIGARPKT